MKTNTPAPDYKGFRFPPEIISHCVWLYFRFSLSFRDVEELMAQRGIIVTYETVRQWCLKFGQTYANELRRCRPRCGNKWHLDEVVLTIRGKKHYLWRAVDQDGNVLDILVRKIRTNQHDYEKRICGNSNRRVMPNASFLSLAPSLNNFNRDVTI